MCHFVYVPCDREFCTEKYWTEHVPLIRKWEAKKNYFEEAFIKLKSLLINDMLYLRRDANDNSQTDERMLSGNKQYKMTENHCRGHRIVYFSLFLLISGKNAKNDSDVTLFIWCAFSTAKVFGQFQVFQNIFKFCERRHSHTYTHTRKFPLF